jgi:hypothetical protein
MTVIGGDDDEILDADCRDECASADYRGLRLAGADRRRLAIRASRSLTG